MASPISMGTSAIVVIPSNVSRFGVRFQNVSATQIIYLKRIPTSGAYAIVSATDYDVRILPSGSEDQDPFETKSTASFMAVASASGAHLAIFETVKI